MDKMSLMMELRAIQKSVNASIDKVMEKVMAMEDSEPVPPPPLRERADGWFNAKMAASYVGVGMTKFWGCIREGIIPPGDYSLGPRSPRWRQSALDACLAARSKEEKHDSEKKDRRKARAVSAACQGV